MKRTHWIALTILALAVPALTYYIFREWNGGQTTTPPDSAADPSKQNRPRPRTAIEEEQDRSRLSKLIKRGNAKDGETFAQVTERLIAQVGPEEKDPNLRAYAIDALGSVWGAEDWVKELITPLVGPEEKDWRVRRQAIDTLRSIYGKQDWFKDLLIPLIGPEEKELSVRGYAISALTSLWGEDESVKNLLVPLISPEEECPQVRDWTISALARTWGKEDWLKELLLPLAAPTEADETVRTTATNYLKEHYPDQ